MSSIDQRTIGMQPIGCTVRWPVRLAVALLWLSATLLGAESRGASAEVKSYLLAHGNDKGVSEAYGGQWVGNGGDPITVIMRKARAQAAAVVMDFIAAAAERNDQNEAISKSAAFLEEKGAEISAALLDEAAYKFYWLVEEPGLVMQETCALTNVGFPGVNPRSVWFTLDGCRASLQGPQAALMSIELLIHEFTHHFADDAVWGDSAVDEDFAYAVSALAVQSWADRKARKGYFWSSQHLGPAAHRWGHQGLLSSRSTPEGVQEEVIFFGGCTDMFEFSLLKTCSRYSNDFFAVKVDEGSGGAVLNVSDLGDQGLPSPRHSHAAFMVGRKMLVYGGCGPREDAAAGELSQCPTPLGDLHAYDPGTGRWEIPVAANPQAAPGPRLSANTVGMEDGFAIWGGMDPSTLKMLDDGAIFHPEPTPGRWVRIEPPPAGISLEGRVEASLIDTGEELIVWGGCVRQFLVCVPQNTGAAYNHETRKWRQLSGAHAPTARFRHGALWNGHRMIVWGGINRVGGLLDGAAYDPVDDSWQRLPTAPAEMLFGLENPQLSWSPALSSMMILGGLPVAAAGAGDGLSVLLPTVNQVFVLTGFLEKSLRWESVPLATVQLPTLPGSTLTETAKGFISLGGFEDGKLVKAAALLHVP